MKDLNDIRKELDSLDGELLQMLINRQELVKEVIAYKNEHSLPIRDRKREQEIIADKINLAAGRLSADFVKNIYRLIIDESCRLQKKLKK